MSASSLETASLSRILFLDDHMIDEKKDLTRTFHEAVKCADSPVITADRPWERDTAFVDSGLVIYDEVEELFKAWYQGGACYGPDDGSCMCYAMSTNGFDWDKPSLGVIEFEGSRDNNIVHTATCMMHDPAPCVSRFLMMTGGRSRAFNLRNATPLPVITFAPPFAGAGMPTCPCCGAGESG